MKAETKIWSPPFFVVLLSSETEINDFAALQLV